MNFFPTATFLQAAIWTFAWRCAVPTGTVHS